MRTQTKDSILWNNLHILATEAGHASLKSFLNDNHLWDHTVGEIIDRLVHDFCTIEDDIVVFWDNQDPNNEGPSIILDEGARIEAVDCWGFGNIETGEIVE